ncbi:MAG TPA: TRAP transporter substrate-binding protein [Beijerinckiaceae bacterium]|nr:TRAP transporter substrate-binding protein [Beijerinckiaceae bacterium]
MQTNEVTPEHAASARWTGRQFHNQPEQSHQHQFLLDLWSDVRADTSGRVAVSVHAQNAGVPGSDPQALDMLQSGELEFMTLMGGILGRAVPATEIQGLPFAFTSHAQVHAVNEGALGAYLDEECRAKGIHRFRHGLLENGFRHIGMTAKPINNAEDLVGAVMRVPDGQMFRDLFTALEAKPVVVNINGLYDALASGRVDGQENPLVVTEVNKLYEVTRFMSLTSHMWSGFNLIANRAFWDGLPGDVQAVIDRHVQKHAQRQRTYTDGFNRELETILAERGIRFNKADTDSFRAKLGAGFYRRWRGQLGETAWRLLEVEIGRLG